MLTFRLDDIAPGLKMDNLKRFEQIFEKHGIKPIIGVVPCNKDPKLAMLECDEDEFWNELIRLQGRGWTIAQHGYEHVYSNENSGILKANPFSEFAGFSYEIQAEKIAKGKKILEDHGLKTTMFMAPGHTFDEITLKALRDNGFKYITDGYTKLPYRRENLVFIPCSLADPKVPKEVDTVCIHLNYWDDEDFANLEKFLNNNVEMISNVQEILDTAKVLNYGRTVIKQEENFRKKKKRRNDAANSEKMQRYLRKSYSENKVIKLMKRVLFLPMLLKK